MARGEGGICVFCKKPFEGWGNNPWPLNDGKGECCDSCNIWVVLPGRMGKPADDLHLDQLEEIMEEHKKEHQDEDEV